MASSGANRPASPDAPSPLTGACAAVVFGLHAAPEYYAFAFIAAGAAMLVFAHAQPPHPRALPAR